MSVTIDWDNAEHTVLLMAFDGRWTWDEVYQASDRSNKELLIDVAYNAHIILDFRASTGLPTLALSHTRTLLSTRSEKIDKVIFVGANATVITLWRTFAQAFKKLVPAGRFNFVATIDEARAMLAEKSAP